MMQKKKYVILSLICCAFLCSTVSVSAADSAEKNDDRQPGRYQFYSTPNALVLLDTKMGKMWKITVDVAGKLKAEGATVEGIAYSSGDLEALHAKLKEINVENIPEPYKKECMNQLVAQFSHALDQERIDKILTKYQAKKE